MGGATSVMPVTRDVFSQQVADTSNWPVRCDWFVVVVVVVVVVVMTSPYGTAYMGGGRDKEVPTR